MFKLVTTCWPQKHFIGCYLSYCQSDPYIYIIQLMSSTVQKVTDWHATAENCMSYRTKYQVNYIIYICDI